jgi:hypothetical protein
MHTDQQTDKRADEDRYLRIWPECKLGHVEHLLLACARVRLTDSERADIRRLAQQVTDWDEVFALAVCHQVTPLLYRSLEAACPEAVPSAIRAALRQEVQTTLQGNLFLTQELVRLADHLREKDIDSIPYKGPLLTLALYGDLSLRQFGDLDLLIHDCDVERTVLFLQSLGYEVIRPTSLANADTAEHAQMAARLAAEAHWAYQVVLVHPQRGALVELHWRVAGRHVLPTMPAGLWKGLRPMTVSGVEVNSLAMENLLWLLCVHATKHEWARLSWICDVAELLRTQHQLDWEKVIALGSELGVERRLYLGLRLANTLLDAPLPQAIVEKIAANKEIESLAQGAADRLFSPSKGKKQEGRLRQLPFQLRALDRGTDRLRLLREAGRQFLKDLRPRHRGAAADPLNDQADDDRDGIAKP